MARTEFQREEAKEEAETKRKSSESHLRDSDKVGIDVRAEDLDAAAAGVLDAVCSVRTSTP